MQSHNNYSDLINIVAIISFARVHVTSIFVYFISQLQIYTQCSLCNWPYASKIKKVVRLGTIIHGRININTARAKCQTLLV